MNDRYKKNNKKFRRNGGIKPKGVRPTPTQQQTFTLPGGRTIELPNYGGGQRTSSRDYDLPDHFDRQIYHPDAGVAYGYTSAGWFNQFGFLFIFGNITIQGQEASGPHEGGDEVYSTAVTDTTWNPGFCMNGPNDPTGNCDILILYHNDTVIGFDNVYNSPDDWVYYPNWPNDVGMNGIIESVDYHGVSTLPYISNTTGINYDLYPSLNTPGFITDILLYRTSTNSFYRPENIDFIMNQIETIIDWMPPYLYTEGFNNLSNTGNYQISAIQSDLNFIPITDTPDILPGDTNVDGDINVLDIVTMVGWILAGWTGEQIAAYYPQADMNGDGSVDILDAVILVNQILNNPTTSSRDRQELQRQLDRLGGDSGTTPAGGNNKKFRRSRPIRGRGSVGRNTQRNRKFRRR